MLMPRSALSSGPATDWTRSQCVHLHGHAFPQLVPLAQITPGLMPARPSLLPRERRGGGQNISCPSLCTRPEPRPATLCHYSHFTDEEIVHGRQGTLERLQAAQRQRKKEVEARRQARRGVGCRAETAFSKLPCPQRRRDSEKSARDAAPSFRG